MDYIKQLAQVISYFEKNNTITAEHSKTLKAIRKYLMEDCYLSDYSSDTKLLKLYKQFIEFKLAPIQIRSA